MDLPRSIKDYAFALGIHFADSLVRCKFCGNTLNYFDISNFDAKHLQLKWLDLKVFGICCTCSKTSAAAELALYYEFSILPEDLLRQGVLASLFVRCVRCYNQLSFIEKLSLIGERRLLHWVRNSYRGLCKFCKEK